MSVRLRLVPAALCAWLSAGVLICVPPLASASLILVWLSAATTITAAAIVRRPYPRLSSHLAEITVCLAVIALIVTVVAAAVPARTDSRLVTWSEQHTEIRAEIVVAGAARASSTFARDSTDEASDVTTIRFAAVLVNASLGNHAWTGRLPVGVTIPVEGQWPTLGASLTANMTLLPAQPGDESAFLLRSNDPPHSVIEAPPWLAWSATLRAGLTEAASRLGGDGGALLPGMAIGDTSNASEELEEAMQASSLSHLTAVSGSNCAIVVGGTFLLCAAAGLRRGARIGVTLIVLAGFVVLVTPEPSVVRAATMSVIVLLALARGSPSGGISALARAVIALMIIDPWLALNAGFALSVAATAGLLLLGAPLGRALARWMPAPLAVLVSVPLAAQLACEPILILLDPSLSLYGVPANLLAAPAAPLVTTFGLAACLLLPLLPGVGFACAQIAWLPATWIAAIARATIELPASRLPWASGIAGAGLAVVVTTLVIWVLGTRRTGPARRIAGAILVGLTGTYLGVVVAFPAVRTITQPAGWDVAACDIGQGDAIVIRDSEQVALVDTGPDPAALSRCLSMLGVDRIDLLVLTHFDLDHVGGVEATVGRVGAVLSGPSDGPRSQRALEPLIDGGANVVEVVAGDAGTLGDLRWSVLWPEAASAAEPGNDTSVTLLVTGPNMRMLLLGDLGEQAQEALRASADLPTVDLVKVAHHGSADQSASLYQEIQATVGLVSVGEENGYGHPAPSILTTLADAGTAILRTDLSGTILIEAGSEGRLEVWSERRARRRCAPLELR